MRNTRYIRYISLLTALEQKRRGHVNTLRSHLSDLGPIPTHSLTVLQSLDFLPENRALDEKL